MRLQPAMSAAVLALLASKSLGGSGAPPLAEAEAESTPAPWEFSLSTSTYVPLHAQDYVNPTLTADRDWLHLEARYNYESLKTGSLWLGYNFSMGEKFVVVVTPMAGGVFGNLTGFAPGYTVSASYGPIEFFTQGEYFIDANTYAGNFFYTWSELSCSATKWLRLGIAIDRTKAPGGDLDVRRGPLIGFRYNKLDFTTYWLSPGAHASTLVFAVSCDF